VKTGVFGGTFDPPHIGHLIAAQDACIELELDRVLFVLAARPPHKEGQAVTPASVRLEMLKAALAGCGRFEACLLELEREGPSYTVDTLRALRGQDPDQELYLLIGADQVAALPEWHEPAQIARLAHIVALTRSGREMRGQRGLHRKVRVTRIDV
jgi:nicotinate-nucleotide adenylyltransferase